MQWRNDVRAKALNQSNGRSLGSVRLADTGLKRIVGLLFESGLAQGDGLLIMPSQGVHTWFMRFPIDVVVLDGDWKVIDLKPEMPPYRLTKVYGRAAAVLELPPGTIRATDTMIGHQLDFARVRQDSKQQVDDAQEMQATHS